MRGCIWCLENWDEEDLTLLDSGEVVCPECLEEFQ
ncbi:hypothetical protein Mbo2_116 [Rhodococcus phage Mbo2]|uniref:Uncharacterized protein n=1 Tax=Rhodococcus phage Mbo2 TaxID=2936911 RepID=A0A9E7LBP4_9CAUD|nr:hypothetical protein Mbo2_116 [Rhodococcus phage Mbo2]